MIRALIGVFVLGCIERAKARKFQAQVRRADLGKMNDREVSDFVHGRPVDFDAIDRRIAGSRGIEP